MAERWWKEIKRKIRQFTSRQDTPEENGSSTEPGAKAIIESEYPPSPEGKNADQVKNFHERVRTTFTGSAVIVAIYAACIASDSRKASWESAGAARESARNSNRSATAAEKSATAGEQNAATTKAAFETVQRASINLGMPDGKIAEFLPGPNSPLIVLYFRNYGTVTAQNTIVEFWPITLFPDIPHSTVHIPPPQKVESFGPAYPPGFPFSISKKYTESSLDELEAGGKALSIVGRVRYADQHREYCESFLLIYIRKPISKFVLMSSGNPMEPLDFCTGREFSMQLGEPPIPVDPNAQQENKK